MFTTEQQSVRLAACGWMDFFANAPNSDRFSRKWGYFFNTVKKKTQTNIYSPSHSERLLLFISSHFSHTTARFIG